MVKSLPVMQETWVQSLGQKDLQEKEMATHSSIFAWKIPWMEEPSRLQSMGLQRVGHDWTTSLSFSRCKVAELVHLGELASKDCAFSMTPYCLPVEKWLSELTKRPVNWLKFSSLTCHFNLLWFNSEACAVCYEIKRHPYNTPLACHKALNPNN